jgi:hypothetical protein
MEDMSDDGTLACLRIPKSDENKHFNCEEITQQKLINLTFYLIDFIDGIDTKYGKDRMIVFIKFNLNDAESMGKKFFTNSQEIKYVMKKIKEMNKLPRKATMRASGSRYYLE